MSLGRCDQEVMALWPPHSNKPQRFELVLVHYSEDNTFDKALEEWQNVYAGGDDYQGQTFCICSHPITNLYYIRNSLNDNVLRVGSECIGKVNFSEEVKNKTKALVKSSNYKGDKRMCQACGRHSIEYDLPAYHTRCKKCYKAGNMSLPEYMNLDNSKIEKSCKDCGGSYLVLPDEEWKNQCTSCYKKSLSLQSSRPVQSDSSKVEKICKDCRKKYLVLPAENWKTQCLNCYRKSRAGN